MAVKVGSARIDENGKARGGQAGDQTGKEVSTQNWYLHSKGWRVYRAKNPSVAEKIAKCMEMACKNSKIGYDQDSRNTLYKEAEPFGCYGWSGESVKLLQQKLTECGFEVVEENVRSLWNPEEADFEAIPALVQNLIG